MKQENYIRGMIMIILSAFFFACMNVSVRLAGDLPSVQKSFFSESGSCIFAAIILIKIIQHLRWKKHSGVHCFYAVHLGHLEFFVISTRLITCWWQMLLFLNKLSPFFCNYFFPSCY